MKQTNQISIFAAHGFEVKTSAGKTYRLNFKNAVSSELAAKYIHSQKAADGEIVSCTPQYTNKERKQKDLETGNLLQRMRNSLFFARAEPVGYEWDYASRFEPGDKVYPTGTERQVNDILSEGFHSSTLYTICDISEQTLSVIDPAGEKKNIDRENFLNGKWTDQYEYIEGSGSCITTLKDRPLAPNEIINHSGKVDSRFELGEYHSPWFDNMNPIDEKDVSMDNKQAKLSDVGIQKPQEALKFANSVVCGNQKSSKPFPITNPIKEAAQTHLNKPSTPALDQEVVQ